MKYLVSCGLGPYRRSPRPVIFRHGHGRLDLLQRHAQSRRGCGGGDDDGSALRALILDEFERLHWSPSLRHHQHLNHRGVNGGGDVCDLHERERLCLQQQHHRCGDDGGGCGGAEARDLRHEPELMDRRFEVHSHWSCVRRKRLMYPMAGDHHPHEKTSALLVRKGGT